MDVHSISYSVHCTVTVKANPFFFIIGHFLDNGSICQKPPPIVRFIDEIIITTFYAVANVSFPICVVVFRRVITQRDEKTTI